jgi:hypothetical protein
MLPKLKALRGKYFLVRRGKIVNYYDSFNDAYSTGVAVYDDKKFSVCLLKAPKVRTKKSRRQQGRSVLRAWLRLLRREWLHLLRRAHRACLRLLRRAGRKRPTFPAMTRTSQINHPRILRRLRTSCALSHFILGRALGGSSV